FSSFIFLSGFKVMCSGDLSWSCCSVRSPLWRVTHIQSPIRSVSRSLLTSWMLLIVVCLRCVVGGAWWGFGVVGLGGRTSSGGGGWWLGGVWCGCILRCRT